MGYLIDTDIIIYSLKNNQVVNANFEKKENIPKAISVISYGELFFGAKKSKFKEKNTAVVHRIAELFPIIDVNQSIIETFGEIKCFLQEKGNIIEDLDIIIAATAMVMDFILVTNNENHFKRIPGLNVENWAI